MSSRRRPLRSAAALLVALALSPGLCSAATPSAPTTVILVRHAEKACGDDPTLTDAGRERAAVLSRVLADAGVSAIYATPPRRTRETAEPVAKARHLEVQVVPVDEGYAAAQAKLLRARPPGSVSLVVSHSNTVPAILQALGVPAPSPIPDDRFDDLFVVTLPAEGAPTLVHLRYGPPSGPAATPPVP